MFLGFLSLGASEFKKMHQKWANMLYFYANGVFFFKSVTSVDFVFWKMSMIMIMTFRKRLCCCATWVWRKNANI